MNLCPLKHQVSEGTGVLNICLRGLCVYVYIYIYIYIYIYTQVVLGGMCQTSGECVLS